MCVCIPRLPTTAETNSTQICRSDELGYAVEL